MDRQPARSRWTETCAPVWRGAPSIILVQQNPLPGKATPFATSVRLLREGSHIYYSWNGYWRAITRSDARGWTAEIEIDVRSLQFSSLQATRGLNVSR